MDPPVHMPNTEVKHLSADNTCLETSREDRSLPCFQSTQLSPRYCVLILFWLFVNNGGVKSYSLKTSLCSSTKRVNSFGAF